MKRDPCESEVILVPVDTPERAETEERAVATELMESWDAFLLSAPLEGASDGFLGGKDGDGPDGCRGGKLGPFEDLVEVLEGSPGLAVPLVAIFGTLSSG